MYNETNNSLMATQQDCIPLICNKNKIRNLRILVKLTFDQRFKRIPYKLTTLILILSTLNAHHLQF